MQEVIAAIAVALGAEITCDPERVRFDWGSGGEQTQAAGRQLTVGSGQAPPHGQTTIPASAGQFEPPCRGLPPTVGCPATLPLGLDQLLDAAEARLDRLPPVHLDGSVATYT
jgi:hypothetical protein